MFPGRERFDRRMHRIFRGSAISTIRRIRATAAVAL